MKQRERQYIDRPADCDSDHALWQIFLRDEIVKIQNCPTRTEYSEMSHIESAGRLAAGVVCAYAAIVAIGYAGLTAFAAASRIAAGLPIAG